MKRILIITGGKFYDKFAADFLEKEKFDMVIAADHGLDGAARIGLPVDVLLGDFDSADPMRYEKMKRTFHPVVITHPPEKDQTDTELAISYAIEQGAEEIVLLGGTGSRMDHMLGTIHSLKVALDRGVPCYIADPWNRIRMVHKQVRIKKEEQYGEYLSLIPFTEKVTGLTLEGMKYPLTNAVMIQGNSLGVSNEILEEEAVIECEDGILLMIESSDKEKYTV